LLQVAAELNAIHYPHRPVCDDEVWLCLFGCDKSLETIASSHHSITLELKDAFPRGHNAPFVVYHKNGFHVYFLAFL